MDQAHEWEICDLIYYVRNKCEFKIEFLVDFTAVSFVFYQLKYFFESYFYFSLCEVFYIFNF